MITNVEMNYAESDLLFRLLKKETEDFSDAADVTDMKEEDRNYILRLYTDLLGKLEKARKDTSEYDET